MKSKKEFIEVMIDAGVLSFGYFTTKSGRKTPYFINTGNYATGAHIAALGDFYAAKMAESGEEFNALFGPAYKGVVLAASAAASLYCNHKRDVSFFFNRKEAKDHGEGGTFVGYVPKDGDKIAIVDDVITAGTAIRESIHMLKAAADVTVTSLFVSVDRMERGAGEKSAPEELKDEFGINVYPIISVYDIIEYLPKGDPRAARISEYLAVYGAAHGD
jgi:orotate phosphoribosyltransferase